MTADPAPTRAFRPREQAADQWQAADHEQAADHLQATDHGQATDRAQAADHGRQTADDARGPPQYRNRAADRPHFPSGIRRPTKRLWL